MNLDDEELELGSKGVGNVFLPLLQKCSNSTNNNKRKIGDDLGVSRVFESSNKKAVDFGEFILCCL